MLSLIGTTKLNDIDPPPWLADVLSPIADITQNRTHQLLLWNWRAAALPNATLQIPHKRSRRSQEQEPIQLAFSTKSQLESKPQAENRRPFSRSPIDSRHCSTHRQCGF
ncbi:transposase domain-containing protein [Sphingobium cyanobacteriorum]|uniref:transposase domain-containing protein n=1 Tax=Sphingobium cyanobacteriorum TaxID=3063954 RepID=UPI003CC6A9E7